MAGSRSRWWLFKTDPDTYSYDDLAAKRGAEVWDGVKNALALQHLRQVAEGDGVLVYHTGSEKAIVGMARVTRSAYPDPSAGDPKLVVVEIAAVRRLASSIPLAEIKKVPLYEDFDLIRLGRLSVMPVPAAILKDLLRRGGEATAAPRQMSRSVELRAPQVWTPSRKNPPHSRNNMNQ